MNWDAIEYVLVTILFGSVGGAISGAFVADFFANRRARQRRKVDLVAFLNAWDSDVVAGRSKYMPAANLFIGIADQFDEKRLKLIGKATAVELDYSGSVLTTFKSLVDKIAKITPGQIGDPQGRNNLSEAIRELVRFVKSNY